MGKLNKVLILSVSVGAGHMRTAQALKKAAGLLYPEAEVVILDTFRYASPFLEKIILGTYMEMLKVTPMFYGYLYRQAERGQPLSGRGKMEFNRVLNIFAAPRLVEYIKNYEPEIIVCTHPFPLGIVAQMKKKGTYNGQLFAVITDFTVHSFWVFPEVDCYLVGAESLQHHFEEFGIELSRVRVTGIPIDPAFHAGYNKRRLRGQLGLHPDLPTILIMGGGLGMGPLLSAVKNLDKSVGKSQLIVVAGTNTALREELAVVSPGLTCVVKEFGFVDNIHQLMAASDFMVGKAGGLTCAEALAMGLPMVIVNPLPGQEERNTEFMTAVGAGIKVREEELSVITQKLLEEQSQINKMAQAALALGKPGAAGDAVNTMAKAVEYSREIS